MSLNPLFHEIPPQVPARYAQLDSASRTLRDTLPEFLAAAAKTQSP